jgi:hypothetical protein
MKEYLILASFLIIGALTGVGLALIFEWTIWVAAIIGAIIPAAFITGMMIMVLSLINFGMSLGKR